MMVFPKYPRKPKVPSISDIKREREESIRKLKDLEAQDETNWTEMDIYYKGSDRKWLKCAKCKRETEHIMAGYRKIFEGQRWRCLVCYTEHYE